MRIGMRGELTSTVSGLVTPAERVPVDLASAERKMGDGSGSHEPVLAAAVQLSALNCLAEMTDSR